MAVRARWRSAPAAATHAAIRCLADTRENVVVKSRSPTTPVTVPLSRRPSSSVTRTSTGSPAVPLAAPLGATALARSTIPLTMGETSAITGLPRIPGGRVPRAISARIAVRSSTPRSRDSSSRWPTPQRSSPSSSTDSSSSTSSAAVYRLSPRRWRMNARTGCSTKRTRSASSTRADGPPGQGPRQERAWLGPRRAQGARAGESRRVKAPGTGTRDVPRDEVARVKRL